MDYEKLAELLFPNVTKTISDYEKMYPKRNLSEGAEVMRVAPSPTGRMHMGNLYASFISQRFAKQSNGIFYVRIEDTDAKRAIENGIELILEDLKYYDYEIDEDPIKGGAYGPYIQTERKEIYHTFAKYLVSIGRAYPCFCTEEDLNELREHQEHKKEITGYYGRYAKCRNLTYEEIEAKINKGEKYVIRLKSMGDVNKKFRFHDLIKGDIDLPENNMDQVLIKSDGIPPYAFAHVVDDYLMGTTIVVRDDSYISSVPYHLELWNAFGFKPTKYAHNLPLNKKDEETGGIRKLSKRKDPEAAVGYYNEQGIPKEAVKLYLSTLMNTNFEEWYLQNLNKSYTDFTFAFDKMSTSGSLFDLDKLMNISKTYISRLKASELYESVLDYTNTYDKDFNKLITKYKDYTINVLNIEREQERPRKDIGSYSDVKKLNYYMYDELFTLDSYNDIVVKDFYSYEILEDYINNYYDERDDKETWFNKIKELCPKYGFCTDNKEYKTNPTAYKGKVGDVCEIIRVAVTSQTMTPDLYEILKLLGKDRIKNRINLFKQII